MIRLWRPRNRALPEDRPLDTDEFAARMPGHAHPSEMSKGFLKRIVEMGDAMWRLDRAVEQALLVHSATTTGELEREYLNGAMHELDRVRGEIWATHNSVSDELKHRDRQARGE